MNDCFLSSSSSVKRRLDKMAKVESDFDADKYQGPNSHFDFDFSANLSVKELVDAVDMVKSADGDVGVETAKAAT